MAADSLFTLSDLALQVAGNLGATDDLTLAEAKKWINRALIRFSEMGYWSWQYKYGTALATVANQENYDIPGTLKIMSLYTSEPIQRKLILVEDRKFRAMFPNNTAVGTPYYWRTTGASFTTANTRKIGLYPIPDTIYALKYDSIAPIPLMTSDTDDVRVITGMPSPLVDLVIEMATAIGWKKIDDADAAKQMQECMIRLKAAYGEDTSEIEDRLIMSPLESDDIDKYYDPQLNPRFGP